MAELCRQCPRECLIDRADRVGFCGVGLAFSIARVALHLWEEPVISGTRGSGTVFFSGCNLRCVFCQNRRISHGVEGRIVSENELEALMLRLQDEGAHNINLVTPTQYAQQLVRVLQRVKPKLRIPVVYNCGGYESVETLRELDGLVDVWLPDFKYYSSELSGKYSSAGNYFEVAIAALSEMLRQQPKAVYGEDGMLNAGVIVRHLVLPGCRGDSIEVLRQLEKRFGNRAFLLSLMNQYTPQFAVDSPYRELHRRVTTFEYDSVLRVAEELGFDGFLQGRGAATAAYTPDFSEKTF